MWLEKKVIKFPLCIESALICKFSQINLSNVMRYNQEMKTHNWINSTCSGLMANPTIIKDFHTERELLGWNMWQGFLLTLPQNWNALALQTGFFLTWIRLPEINSTNLSHYSHFCSHLILHHVRKYSSFFLS